MLALLVVLLTGCGRRDDAIAADLRAQLNTDPSLRHATISVIVKKGIVLLRGQVVDADQTPRAIEKAGHVPGVRRVITQITLSDDSIRAAVVHAIRQDPLLAEVPITVTVVDGVVRLASDATNADQRERAVIVARGLSGVVDVEDEMK